jgi:transcription initiation factor TFIIIB Brf1 subunit/transcription initiation factor TFIIB
VATKYQEIRGIDNKELRKEVLQNYKLKIAKLRNKIEALDMNDPNRAGLQDILEKLERMIESLEG